MLPKEQVMKKFILIIVFILSGCSATEKELIDSVDSTYSVYYDHFISYKVDTIIEKCFAAFNHTIIELSCESLAKRPEWKSIITWVNTD